ncbi:restriction endonuclease subunit S [Nostoc sp. FACHB-280]|uniref:restriction endonuclease subunit S n=1 Tax=Nostoc sp. FACHB-280 TaxID=2692839 RepID=UPI00168C0076|nr:restriction endonuclease subunit S [Nostoc sp. FACHB-280]MBD2493575.1 restriction endonuclease subunit S [Nostoc sp. FACHB-280]
MGSYVMGKYQGYGKYKDSGVEWLGEIPEHWEVCHIKRVANVSYGVGGEIDKGLTDGVNLLSLPNVTQDGVLIIDDFGFCELNEQEKEKVLLQKGDLLFNWRNGSSSHLGKTAYFDLDGEWTHVSFLLRLRFNAIESDSKYFQYMLNGLRITGFFMVSKAGVNNTFNLNELNNLKVIYPPPDEQKAIARFLDYKTKQIDDLIAKKEALIAKLDEKRTALISHAVTKGLDPTVPMKDSGVEWLGEIPEHWSLILLRLRYLIELGKMLDQRRISGDYLVKYLRNVDVQWDFINQNDLPEMDINPNEYERYLVKNGDLLVCEGGESGRSAIVQGVDGILGFQKAIHRLRVIGTEEIPRFLFYTFYYLVKLGVFVAEGNPNTITHLTVEKLKLYRLPRPPKKEQQAIVTYLDHKTAEIKQQKAKIQQAIELLKEYRTALITNAVTGKIDVRQVPIP